MLLFMSDAETNERRERRESFFVGALEQLDCHHDNNLLAKRIDYIWKIHKTLEMIDHVKQREWDRQRLKQEVSIRSDAHAPVTVDTREFPWSSKAN